MLIALTALACGTKSSGFESDASVSGDGGLVLGDGSFGFGDSGSAEAGCVNLQCKQTCGTTSISGYVYDPKGTVPLYNVYVYVPNDALAAIPSTVTCAQCQAPASGSPVASATTDETGHFSIPNAPIADNIQLVMQLGKWRRVVTLPHIQACEDNQFNTKTNPKDNTAETLLRMPRKQAEQSQYDNIPQIAVTTGECDYTECFLLNTVGIDQTEFQKGGRVNIYDGVGGETSYPYTYGNAVTNLYDKISTMMNYDIILNSCECSTNDRGTGYANVESYLNGGGRFFGTHYMYNFFASAQECANSYSDPTCKGPADFNGVAQWMGDGAGTYGEAPFLIDQTFPKGSSMAKWINNVQGGTLGQLDLFDTRQDVNDVTTGKATRWIYTDTPGGNATTSYSTVYLSFNTPTTAQTANQCGRAVFSDVHVAGSDFTGFCQNGDSLYAANLAALEFLFFDLSSCVQDDTQPPITPN